MVDRGPTSNVTASHINGTGGKGAPGRRKRQVTIKVSNNVKEISFGAPPEAVDMEYKFLKMYMELPEMERKLIGHDFSGFIMSCLFEGQDCLDER